jgi:hypothetical protein
MEVVAFGTAQFMLVYTKAIYNPRLAAKITLNQNARQMIRVRLGISTDISSTTPKYIISFPVFNFQGGIKYMQ